MRLPGNLDLVGGQLQNASAHRYTSIPTYVVGDDDGRIVYVSVGASAGFWMGTGLGWTQITVGAVEDTWDIVGEVIADGATVVLTPASPSAAPTEKGFLAKVVVSTTATSGFFTVRVFNDTARTDKIYEAVFDAAGTLFTDRIPSYYELDNSSGDLYVNIVNNTGGTATFSVSIVGAGTQTVPLATPPGSGSGIHAGVAGDGIGYDVVNARLDVNLAAVPGLELVGTAGSRKLRVLVDPAGGIAIGAPGVACDATVLRTTGNQSSTGVKGFSQLRCVPTVISGPPVAGAHLAGEFSMDVNQDLWMCVTAGTPGSWVFWGWKETVIGGLAAGTSYTGACAAATSVDLVLPLTSRRGVIRKLSVWGFDDAFAAVNIDAPFRVECYPNEGYEGREMLWSVAGQVRSTYFSAPTPAPDVTLPVNTVGNVSLDDLVRLRNTGVAEEWGRVIVRTPAGPSIDIDEATVYNYLANDLVGYATEVMELFFRNNSAVPANYSNLYLRFYNDHPTQDLKFGYHGWVEQLGGGLPI
jgi:hypothetical protein